MQAVEATFDRFFSERGTHLAAMVAYFALASFVPLIFLALSVLGFSTRPTRRRSSLPRGRLPASVESIVSVVERGAEERCDSSPSSSRALELALALLVARVGVQHRLRPPQPAVPARQGPRRRLHSVALVVLFVGLTAGTLGYDLLRRATDAVSNRWVALGLTLLTSGAALFAFLLSAFYPAAERPPDASGGAAWARSSGRSCSWARCRRCRCSCSSRRRSSRSRPSERRSSCSSGST